jgi:16S rRNA (guanine527-N7)-methyltransferase
MDVARIAELLEPFLEHRTASAHGTAAVAAGPPLTASQLDQISTYIDILIRWNARVNLTSIRSPEEIVTRHFGESLFAARHLLPCAAALDEITPGPPPSEPGAPPAQSSAEKNSPAAHLAHASHKTTVDAAQPYSSSETSRVADLGSGAGFPGLPMKIWCPPAQLTLIESRHKKVAFLREVIRALTLTNVNVFAGRAEDFPPASVSLLTLRAVERFDSILPMAPGLLSPTGRLALLIGQAQVRRVHAVAPSLLWSPPVPIPLSQERALLVGQKVTREEGW